MNEIPYADEQVKKLIYSTIGLSYNVYFDHDPLFLEAEEFFLYALLRFFQIEFPIEKSDIIAFLNLFHSMDNDDEAPFNKVFSLLQKEQPDHAALLPYLRYRQCAGSCAWLVSETCIMRLRQLVVMNEIREIIKANTGTQRKLRIHQWVHDLGDISIPAEYSNGLSFWCVNRMEPDIPQGEVIDIVVYDPDRRIYAADFLTG